MGPHAVIRAGPWDMGTSSTIEPADRRFPTSTGSAISQSAGTSR